MNDVKKKIIHNIGISIVCISITLTICYSIYSSNNRQLDRELNECRTELSVLSNELDVGRERLECAQGTVDSITECINGLAGTMSSDAKQLSEVINQLRQVREAVYNMEVLLHQYDSSFNSGNSNFDSEALNEK